MASPVAGQVLRYLIGVNNDRGQSGTCTLVGYDTSAVPIDGTGAGYINRRQEKGGRLPGVDYKPADDIEIEYGEPAPVFGTAYFWKNIDIQCNRLWDLGFRIVEIDNLDTDNVALSLDLLSYVAGFGFKIWVKNPHLVPGPKKYQLCEPTYIVGMIVEQSEVGAGALNELRKAAKNPELPIRVVAYEDEDWANDIADQALDLKLRDFGVTFSPDGEYETSINIKEPTVPNNGKPPKNEAPWVLALPLDLGKYHDGSDVPMLCDRVASRFKEDEDFVDYCDLAGPETAWCGIYAAEMLSRWGLKPPHADDSTGGFMYVDAWLPYGTPIPHGQQKPGDLALWINNGGMHHIAFVHTDGMYIGGNQSNTVTKASFPTPGYFRRPPPPLEEWKPSASDMPMLMVESVGPAVRVLQTGLNNQNAANLEVDGEFGPATETAVINYQRSRGLEVDGIVGQETWQALYDKLPPVPVPEGEDWLTEEEISHICNLAKSSQIAIYSWRDRGVAPLGYTKGMAVMYGQSLRKLKAGDSALIKMTQRIGADPEDALEYYGVETSGEKNILRELFVMLLGLGMRESSGNYTEGRDMSADNVSADTAEAGCFQQSWNSHVASSEMDKLLNKYYGTEGLPCYAGIWSEGITQQNEPSYGSGSGRHYQDLAKTCPAFAVEMCGVGLRVLYNHWGPIIREEVEMRPEARALFEQIYKYLAAMPEAPEPAPEPHIRRKRK